MAPNICWRGFYLDGNTSVPREVAIHITDRGFVIKRSDASDSFWDYQEIRLTQGAHRGEQVRFEKREQSLEALIVPDRAILSDIRRVAPGCRRQFRSAEFYWRRRECIATGLGLILMLSYGYFWLLPFASAQVAVRVPVSLEERIGEATVNLSEPLTANPYKYRIVVSRDPRVNALAAPGGYIVLFQGLLETTKTPEQLAGVLAHEMQHVLQRHSTKAIFREASLHALLAVLAGDMKASSVAVQCAAILGRLHHSRQDEEAADREAMRMLQKARVDPAGMLEFLAFMGTPSDSERMVPAYLSTHPPTQERIAQLRRMAASSSYMPERLLSGRSWSEVLIPCGFIGQVGAPGR